ncbi:MAG: DUF4097 domain-containing protein [Clostridiales bacterium]|jgi:hypothetical protein|nr:DUF4097 domain-containing protein [Clostridiales bacterium]
MPNEKLVILKMLEEGKISAKEAGRLLEASDREDSRPPRQTYGGQPGQSASPGGYDPGASYPGGANNRPYDDTPRPAGGLDGFAGDLSRKFDAFARDLEPKLQRFSETVVEKTADFADKISRSLEDSSRPPARSPLRADSQEKRFELFVSPGYNELNIAGLNGDVLIHGYNGDKISASVFCRPRRLNAPLSFMRLGNKYFLNYDDDEFEKVTVDAYVPESMFNVVTVNTINGILDVSTLSAENISLNNSNGQTKLQSLAADFLRTECNNGRLDIGIVKARNARVENFNGAIDVLDLDSSNLKLTSVNGGIVVNMSHYAAFSDYVWDIESSNGKMTLNLPTYPDLGYHVKAHASLGQIRIGLTNLNYLFNSSSLTEAKSISFDRCSKKVKLALETSNATLQIN